MAPHSSTLAWKIPWMEEPGRLQSMGSRRVRHNWATSLSLFTFLHWRRKWQPTPVFLPGESQGQGSLVAAVYGVAQSRTRLKRLSIAFIDDSSPFFSFNNKSNMVLIKPSSAGLRKDPHQLFPDLLCRKQWNCALAQRSLGTSLGKRRRAFTFNFESIRHGLSTLCHWPVRMKEHKTKLF